MRWISSTGGPLIIMEKQFLSLWAGCETGDYDWACSISDYIGIIKKNKFCALVLNGEPLSTTVYPLSKQEIIIARWEWGESEEVVEKYISKYLLNCFSQKAVEKRHYFIKSGKLLLFDAAASGREPVVEESGKDAPGEEINLKKDEYTIYTNEYQPNDKNFLILHKIVKVK